MNVSIFSALQLAKAELVAAKEEILSEWVHERVCADILLRHDIDMELFYGYYASNVFDYFIGVVSGEVELGKCPVMGELIEYLKNKEIRAEELFILCSHLKHSVINATYTYNIHSKALFEAISYLFDRNFAGVLELYTDTIYQKEQEAILHATKDLDYAFEQKQMVGSDHAVADSLKSKGYLSVENFNIVK